MSTKTSKRKVRKLTTAQRKVFIDLHKRGIISDSERVQVFVFGEIRNFSTAGLK